MRSLSTSVIFLLGSCHLNAAISILIEPNEGDPDSSFFTLIETSPNPVLDSAATMVPIEGLAIPTSMFNISGIGMGPGASSDITGGLTSSLGDVTEVSSSQSFTLSNLRVNGFGGPSFLRFETPFDFSGGRTSAQFQITSGGRLATNVGIGALHPGVHTIESPAFGLVTVTVVPEPSSSLLALMALVPVLRRRRYSGDKNDSEQPTTRRLLNQDVTDLTGALVTGDALNTQKNGLRHHA